MRVRCPGLRVPPGGVVMTTVMALPGIRGRAAETRMLDEALDRMASGQPAVVLIEGEAGIGKTRLLAETLAEARGRDVQVAAGRAEELEQGRPFGLMAGAFECVRSAPDRRRAAIGELLVTGGAGDEGPITVTSDPGLAVPRSGRVRGPGGGARAVRAAADRGG